MELGFDPINLALVVITHSHIDHVGGLIALRDQFGAKIAVHSLDAEALERADDTKTAASWYGIKLPPISVDQRLEGEQGSWTFGDRELHWIHTPGHTPGSISPYLDTGAKRVLFGQDIHGPFSQDFGSNLEHWHQSMHKLLALNADILCEGHFGVYEGKNAVKQYIESYVQQHIRS
jgi:glyoxylase-like metal-dependent hydrolase (beta-lactamase superfamily II)